MNFTPIEAEALMILRDNHESEYDKIYFRLVQEKTHNKLNKSGG